MKFRLLLVVSLLTPFVAKAQSSSTDVIFFSKGKMYVQSKSGGSIVDSTSLHVSGSMKFGDGAQIEQKGRTELAGDFISAIPSAAAAGDATIFVNNSSGVIAFVGQDNKQTIKFADPNQKSSKHFIAFPVISVEQKWVDHDHVDSKVNIGTNPKEVGFVALDPSAAITVDKLSVKNHRRFRVESSFVGAAGQSKINTGHLVFNTPNSLDDNASNDATKGFTELNLLLNDSANGSTNAPNLNSNGKYLTGFTVPFEELGADYMFYQVLTKPNAYSVTSYEGPIVNPFYRMRPGVGYFMAMDVMAQGDLTNGVDGRWGTSFSDRASGGYLFSRRVNQDYHGKDGVAEKHNFNKFAHNAAGVNTSSDQIERVERISERFNTGDVKVKVLPGLNFLGNPFLAPISLNPLINWGNAGLDDFTIDEILVDGQSAKVSRFSATDAVLRAKYWVINQASVESVNSNTEFNYKVTYDYVSGSEGSSLGVSGLYNNSVNITDPQNYLIAPMQMFCLQASREATLTLTTKLIQHGPALMPKSASSQTDWFVMEAETVQDQAKDRTVINFSNAGKLSYDELRDTRKGLTKQMEESKDIAQVNNLLYTKSSDGVALLGNTVPKTVKELALYYVPPTTTQTVRLRPLGLQQLESVKEVWLVDKYENKTVKLSPETVYEFVAQPAGANQAVDNRFVLRFYDAGDTIFDKEETSITCYYYGSTLHVLGLNDQDNGSNVMIYDLQGRLFAKKVIKNAPQDDFVLGLEKGTYIVKIAGKRNYTTKFVNLHN